MEAAWKRSGVLPDMLRERTPCPPGVAYLKEFYAELSLGRRSGFAGVEPLAWGDIHAWCVLTGVRLEPWEVRALRRMDSVFMEVLRDVDGA